MKPQRLQRFLLRALVLLAGALAAVAAAAREPLRPEQIRFIHMGGNDCPPCRVWRGVELPRLQQSPGFSAIQYSYVTKTVRSPVPPEMFLPEEVKPLKARLDHASGGRDGSPHQVLVVNGEVFDYWFGTRDAAEIEAAIQALLHGTRYPHRRCMKRTGARNGACEIPPRPPEVGTGAVLPR